MHIVQIVLFTFSKRVEGTLSIEADVLARVLVILSLHRLMNFGSE